MIRPHLAGVADPFSKKKQTKETERELFKEKTEIVLEYMREKLFYVDIYVCLCVCVLLIHCEMYNSSGASQQ